MMNCDPETGACLLPDLPLAEGGKKEARASDWVVRYVGDPMCSWCWGIAPTVRALADFCAARGVDFVLSVGGLRAGGGDPWNAPFKEFLRREWRHIQQTTGQPFGFTLLEASSFDYDTEPACRAVVAASILAEARGMRSPVALSFFSAIQFKFYVHGKDPKEADFYRDICDGLELPFEDFREVFLSTRSRNAVEEEFARCRQWGVRSFPSLLLERQGRVSPLAAGYVEKDALLARLAAHLDAR